jgi:uncharacterized membrane protein
MMVYFAGYFGTFVAILVADMVWFGLMVSRLYRPALTDILLGEVNLGAAIAFYLIYPLGLMIFAILPALKGGGLIEAVKYGALFGFFTYVTYDLTCQATLRNWTTRLTLIDVAWGVALGAFASFSGFLLISNIGGLPPG